MPIYEYRCPDCEHQFDRLQKLSEPPVSDCPSCGLGNVRKLISRTSFTLKGGGWYSDHYGLKSGGSSDGKSAGESSGSSTKDVGGSSGSSSPSPAASPAPAAAAASAD